jgi:predicted nuclease of predicted toxin-antitoxin system
VRLLLDENIPIRLRQWLSEHEAVSAEYMGWKGVRNGQLLTLAEQAGFDQLLTADGKMYGQQTLTGRSIGILAIPTNHARTIQAIAHHIQACVEKVRPGQFHRMAMQGSPELWADEVLDDIVESPESRTTFAFKLR